MLKSEKVSKCFVQDCRFQVLLSEREICWFKSYRALRRIWKVNLFTRLAVVKSCSKAISIRHGGRPFKSCLKMAFTLENYKD